MEKSLDLDSLIPVLDTDTFDTGILDNKVTDPQPDPEPDPQPQPDPEHNLIL